ncbi:uncharacterized protein CBL_02476 [Carabus blaptoides fortunei]
MLAQHVLTVTAEQDEEMKKLIGKSNIEIEKDVNALKDWLNKSPHLPKNEDDIILRRILYYNKFSLEKSKQKLDLYYSSQNLIPEFFENRNPLHASMQKVFDYGMVVPLPKLTNEFQRISISKQITNDNPNFDGWEYVRFLLSTYEYRLWHDRCVSDIFVVDLVNTSFNNLLKISPSCIVNMFAVSQKTYSDKIHSIHIINASTAAHTIIDLLKTLFNAKMGQRIHVHNDLESLYKHVPKDILPEDYGGSEKPLMELHKNWRAFLESQDSWMIDRMKMKSNEKLRPGQPINSDLLGIQGSFRQLNVD